MRRSFMVLLAALQLLLHRYSGQDDIAVGSAVTHRPHAQCEGLIGFFVNTLVLRVDMRGQPSLREYLARVREVCLDAYAHQDMPFEKLVEELKPRRELNRQPLCQAFLVLQNTPNRPRVPAGLVVEPLAVDNRTAQYDLSLYLRERGGRLLGYFEYATDLFDAATVERMARHFEILLTDIAAHPDRAIDSLAMLSENEQRRMLVEWNDTAAAYPSRSCIHELFEAQVARTPDAIAVEFAISTLTFAALNRRANRVAHYLRGRGVGAEHHVGLLLGRCLEMVVGMLGILKAGAAYVPLDPSYPPARLDFMAADAELDLVAHPAKSRRHNLPGELFRWFVSTIAISSPARVDENPPGVTGAASAGLCDLHFGFHRVAQRRGRAASRRGESMRLDVAALSVSLRRSLLQQDFVEFCRFGVGNLRTAAARRSSDDRQR